MNLLLLPLSIVCGLTLCGTAVSVLAVHRAYCLLREMNQRAGEKQSHSDAGNQALRDTVEALAAQIHDLQNHPPVAPTPGIPRPGLNLSKRSHALRMHRRGEGSRTDRRGLGTAASGSGPAPEGASYRNQQRVAAARITARGRTRLRETGPRLRTRTTT